MKRGQKIKCSLPLAFDALDLNVAQVQCVLCTADWKDWWILRLRWHAWKTFTTGHLLRLNCILWMEVLKDPSDRRKWTWWVLISPSKKSHAGWRNKKRKILWTSSEASIAQLQCVCHAQQTAKDWRILRLTAIRSKGGGTHGRPSNVDSKDVLTAISSRILYSKKVTQDGEEKRKF